MNEKIITLEYPIPIKQEDGTVIETKELRMGRVKMKHIENLPPNLLKNKGKNVTPKDLIPVIAGLCGISEDTAREIDLEDIEKVVDVVTSFLDKSQVSGPK